MFYLLQHRIDCDVSPCPADPGAAVNDDWASVNRVRVQRLPDVSQNRKRVTRNSMIRPARVVKLFHLAVARCSFQLKNKNNHLMLFSDLCFS